MLNEAGVTVEQLPGHASEDIARAGAGAFAIFVYSAELDDDLLGRLGACRVIARCGTGYDKIDVGAAVRRGMVVTYVPEYGAVDVAEHTIALVLACARRLAQSDREVQEGGWPSYACLGPMRRLAGQSLGLLGFGRIARQVAARARGFELAVLAHDPFVPASMMCELGVQPVTFGQLLARADFLSIHLPLAPATHHLLDESALSLLKRGAYVINTSRGGVVDQAALTRLLDQGQIAGAALDVLEQEPPRPADGLIGRPDVLVTPHSAAFTEEALAEVRRTALLDVLRVLRGDEPLYPVRGRG